MPMLVVLLIWFIMLGACIGSFLNVVILRLPLGKEIVYRSSHCRRCMRPLRWYDNVPIVSWVLLRGACRYCGHPISAQYIIIEAITAGLFGGFFFLAYIMPIRPEFSGPGILLSWPVLLVYLILFSSLIAITVIDARYYYVMPEMTWLVIGSAAVIYPLTLYLMPHACALLQVPVAAPEMSIGELSRCVPSPYQWSGMVNAAVRYGWSPVLISPVTLAGPAGCGLAFGGIFGLLISSVALRLGLLPRSFADLDQQIRSGELADTPETWMAYAHARREAVKELLFLLPIIAGMVGGYFLLDANWLMVMGEYELAIVALGGVARGMLIGGGIVWATRILGTLAFGKEAMGMGDVHILAAVGAVGGGWLALFAFVIAPFVAIGWVVLTRGLSLLFKLEEIKKPIPFGPHLAFGTAVAIVAYGPMFYYIAAPAIHLWTVLNG